MRFLRILSIVLFFWPGLPLLAQQPPPFPATPQQAPPPAPPLVASAGRVIVLDPAHGGIDAGARGPSGVIERDVVLTLAQAVRAELEKGGLHVILTRRGAENPSFDERAALANSFRNAIFITLHVSSTGTVGTARAYYFAASGLPPAAGPGGLIRWDLAQESFASESRRFAESVAVQLGRNFRGSPEIPEPGAVRQLRSVAAPAVAIEVSSVAVADRAALEKLAPALAQSVSRAVAAYTPASPAPAAGASAP